MRSKILISAALSMLFATATVFAHSSGKYYGLSWDGTTEHFVSFDPATSTSTVLAPIPDVQLIAAANSAFDTHCDRYVFIGGAKSSAMSYYVIDAHTGAVLSQSAIAGRAVDNIAYSPKDRAFYGILWDASTGTESFVFLDPYTSTTTILAAIPGVKLIQAFNYTFDTDSNRYVFIGGATSSSMSYYVIDAGTGAVISQSAVGGKLNNLKYSPKDKAFYGLTWDGSTEYLAVFDPYTSATTVLDPIPNVKLIAAGNSTFNTDCNQYVFIGGATSSSMSYYALDASNGSVVSQSPVGGKINNLQYDGKCKRKCVRHRRHRICQRGDDSSDVVVEDSVAVEEEISTTGEMDGPVPSLMTPTVSSSKPFVISGFGSNDIVLQVVSDNQEAVSFVMLDMSGKSVVRMDGIRSNQIRVDGKSLNRGMYFFQIRSSKALIGAGKLMVR